jgi:4-amino-4-deoxy-L-arabinose transferase-like glycosyltransferase
MKKSTTRILLILILFTAAFFRLWQLNNNPPALFRDEAEKGYTAWTISKCGGSLYFDLKSRPMALKYQKPSLFINVFGVHTSAAYQYAAAPFIMIFGFNEWTIRLPAAISGILTVLMLYFLVLLWTEDKKTALISSLLLAISPWHILFSRWALQGIFLPLFITVGLYFFSLGIKKKSYFLILSAIIFGLSFYTYAIARLFIPLLLVCILIIYRKKIWSKKAWAISAASIFLLLSVPVFIYYITGSRSARFSTLSLFGGNSGIIKPVLIFITNYIKHFSPGFLFLYGDSELRHSLSGMGQMYLFEAPLLIYGLSILIRERKKYQILLLFWFLIFPVAASLTREGIPHALRSIVALPMMQIICAIAISDIISRIKKFREKFNSRQYSMIRIAIILSFIAVFAGVFSMSVNLFKMYPADSATNWQYGLKQALEKIHEYKADPERVFISGYITFSPYLVMAYDKIDPLLLKEEGIRGIKYKFLPPGRSISSIWHQLVPGDILILLPGELRGKKPVHTIYLPEKAGEKEFRPALEIFKKDR